MTAAQRYETHQAIERRLLEKFPEVDPTVARLIVDWIVLEILDPTPPPRPRTAENVFRPRAGEEPTP
jgi:hypothetical protein